jgi:hypothetical protein
MPSQIVERGDRPHTFTCYWLDDRGFPVSNGRIFLDFNPVVTAANLERTNHWAIVHFQARPVFLRRFGVYDGREYCCVDTVDAATPYRTVKLHETNLIYPPNAVIVHEKSLVTVNGEVALISPFIK